MISWGVEIDYFVQIRSPSLTGICNFFEALQRGLTHFMSMFPFILMLFCYLFGCPRANFGPLSRRKPHPPDDDHYVS